MSGAVLCSTTPGITGHTRKALDGAAPCREGRYTAIHLYSYIPSDNYTSIKLYIRYSKLNLGFWESTLKNEK